MEFCSSMLYKYILRPILFLLPPETAHHVSMFFLRLAGSIPPKMWIWKHFIFNQPQGISKTVCGIEFKNPVGLAAGLDKDAIAYKGLAGLGFGFIEVGTVTPLGQPGNEKPRLFRLKQDQALINRMGFNNNGVEAMREKLKNRPSDIIIGGNIGKNKSTPNELAVNDYLKCFKTLFDLVDYFVINISSPNTPGLRDLQQIEPIRTLFKAMVAENEHYQTPKPLFVKLAPDMSNDQLNAIVDIAVEERIHGIIASNTTISRTGLKTNPEFVESIGQGGLSGKPLSSRSTEVVRLIRQRAGNKLAIIASGGICSGQDALDKLEAGADLVQIYTGFIYEGPGLIKQINKKIAQSA